MVKKRNVIIGAARGYSFEQLRPFFLSLSRTTFDGESVLLWSELNLETRAALQQLGVTLVHIGYAGNGPENPWSRFWPLFRMFAAAPIGSLLKRGIYKKLLNIGTSRFIHALDFLENRTDLYGNVLLSDVRDVIFQDDPFRNQLRCNLVAFLEAPQLKFGEEPNYNDRWIYNNYGMKTLDNLRGFRISCCGTVMGNACSIVEYLRNFVAEIGKLKTLSWGADTSVHNVLVRDVMKNDFCISENLERVATLGNECFEKIRYDASGLLLGRDGRPVPILHQCPPEILHSLYRSLLLN